MHSKSLLIAVAAFVLTTSSAQAFFNDKEMKKAGFTEAQIEAFAEARELKKQGKIDEAKEVILKVVKVDNKKIETLRENLFKGKKERKSNLEIEKKLKTRSIKDKKEDVMKDKEVKSDKKELKQKRFSKQFFKKSQVNKPQIDEDLGS